MVLADFTTDLQSDYTINDPSDNRSRPNFARSTSSFDNRDYRDFSDSSVNLVGSERLGRATGRDSSYSLVDQVSPRQNVGRCCCCVVEWLLTERSSMALRNEHSRSRSVLAYPSGCTHPPHARPQAFCLC